MKLFEGNKISKLGRAFGVLIAIGVVAFVAYVSGYYQGTGALPRFMAERETVFPPESTTEQTFENVSNFVAEDTTDQEVPDGDMNCVEYALLLARSAQWKGLDAAVVKLDFEDGTSHMMLMFPTVDRGWIYVEPQTDREFNLAVGKLYDSQIIMGIWVLGLEWIPIDEFLGVGQQDG